MEIQNLQDCAKLLSCNEIAEQYDVTRNTVFRYCKTGKIQDCVDTRKGYLVDPDVPPTLWKRRADVSA